jgi:hypothetical protein
MAATAPWSGLWTCSVAGWRSLFRREAVVNFGTCRSGSNNFGMAARLTQLFI